LEREEQQDEAKLAALRAAIDEGDASGIAEDGVFARPQDAQSFYVALARGCFSFLAPG
jgi:hypothetical protein